jgi:hypothetical protein
MTSPSPLVPSAPGPPPPSRRATAVFLAACLLVVVLIAAGLHFLGPRSAPPGVTMADLHGVADLQARFNADRGQPRLVVIFSPT